jgi:predicted nucleic acid-binding Zn ribbon protein
MVRKMGHSLPAERIANQTKQRLIMPLRTDDDDERCLRDDLKRKVIRLPVAKKMADALSSLLARKGYARVLSTSALDTAWQQAVGPRLAGHARPGAVTRGVLEVLVRSSAVVQELTFAKSKIMKKLAELCPQEKIRDVKFRVAPLD